MSTGDSRSVLMMAGYGRLKQVNPYSGALRASVEKV
nr:MAG TPA: hypothetical protein [Caudoviricetes sp.]